jgi:hypothetical protein
MKIKKSQLRRIIKEEKAKLLNESLGDTQVYQDIMENAANDLSDMFYDDMMTLFEEEPEAFAGRSDRQSWEQQVVYAQQELDSGIITAIEKAFAETEMRLHDGQFDTGRH